MKKSVNLDKLKEEISREQSKKNQTHGSEGAPKDKFLYGLLSSLKTGQVNEATNLIKTVDNHTAKKLGEKPKLRVDENVPAVKPQPKTNVPGQPAVDMSPEREEDLYRKFESSRKQTLAESLQGYYNQGHKTYPQQQYPQHPQQAPMLNEEHLMGAVKGTVDKYLTENFGLVVEEAIKSTILEMYAVERIKEVLNENRDLVKTLVYETIREIQEKNKMKKG